MAKVGTWSTTAGSNNFATPNGWPEGQAPSTVNDCAREMMAALRTAFNDLQFFDQDLTPTYVSATQFSVTGNQTSAIHAGRRLKIYDATAGVATTIYATVTTASFTAVTNIHVSADAGQLTSSLSSFAMAILSRSNRSYPLMRASDIEEVTGSGSVVLATRPTLTDPNLNGHIELTYSATIVGAGVTIDWANGLNQTFQLSAATALITLPTASAGRMCRVLIRTPVAQSHSFTAVAGTTLRWGNNNLPGGGVGSAGTVNGYVFQCYTNLVILGDTVMNNATYP